MHSFVGTRKEIIDLGLLTGKGGFTDILQLVQDSSPRPSSTLYYPMTDLNNNVIGMFAGIFRCAGSNAAATIPRASYLSLSLSCSHCLVSFAAGTRCFSPRCRRTSSASTAS